MNPSLYYLLLFSAYDALPAQEAQALNYSWAIVMTLLAVPLLSQRLNRSDVLAAILCYSGVLMIATRGDVLGLNFANQEDQREPVLGLCLNFSFALPLIIAVAAGSGQLVPLFDAPWQAAVGGLYVGLFEMGLAFIWWLKAMKLAENTARIANLIFISPFLSLALISVFLDEAILNSTLIGLFLIIMGLALQQLFAQSRSA